jgi:hypothetical protein
VRYELNLWSDSERPPMSERSQRLASHARQFDKTQPAADAANVNRNRMLNEGFARLRDKIEQEFRTQVDEFNGEPDRGTTLACRFFEDKLEVVKVDDAESVVSVHSDSHLRTAEIVCNTVIKFGYLFEVRLNSTETTWYHVAGEKKSDFSAITSVDWIVEKALYALFGLLT